MRFAILWAAAALQVAIGISTPLDEAIRTPATSDATLLPPLANDVPEWQCPRARNCGAVTYYGSESEFGEGVCMPLSPGIKMITVHRCYCSLWSVCTGNNDIDVYLGGMAMCQKPAVVPDFASSPRFISCGGLNAPGGQD